MNEIKIRCSKRIDVSLDELINIQGKAKIIPTQEIDKLLKSFETFGFIEPFSIWKKPDGSKILLAGNQRLLVLKIAKERQYKLPEKFPANLIEAKDEQEAAEMLLALASTFGKADKKEVELFCKKFSIKKMKIASFTAFREFSLSDEKQENNANSQKNSESGQDGITSMRIPFFDHEFDRAETMFESAYQKLKSIHPETIAKPSDAFLFVMEHIVNDYQSGEK